MRLPRTWRGRALLAVAIPPALVVAVFIVLSATGRVAAYQHPSGSMEPTLRCGDRYVVERLTARGRDPRRGDIVAFHPPAGAEGPHVVATPEDGSESGARTVRPADTTYVKRVVGLPGERVEVVDHRAIVDGDELEEPYVFVGSVTGGGSDADWGPKEVPEGTYLLLGDHRDNSADGRVFGFVPEEFVEGRVSLRYWPPRRVGMVADDTSPGELERRADPACRGSFVPG